MADPKPKKRRVPVLSAILVVLLLIFCVRSVSMKEGIVWWGIENQRGSTLLSAKGVQAAQLGLRLYFEERLFPESDAERTREFVDSMPKAGLDWTSSPLTPDPSILRWLGFGLEQCIDDRPESFENVVSVTVPLWLLAALLAIRPVRYVRTLTRQTPEGETPKAKGESMKTPIVVALVCGVLAGAAVTYFVARPSAAPGDATGSAASASIEVEKPIHPIVGVWRIDIGVVAATYTFGNDGNFALSFKNLAARPSPNGQPAPDQQAGGTWKVDGDSLRLHNTSSNTPYTIVGEDEDAKIVSITADTMVLEHEDRKGKPEKLEFTRVRPFVKGRIENKALIGKWRDDKTLMDLAAAGDVTFSPTVGNPLTGQWCQEGKRLRLLLDPPAQPTRAQPSRRPTRTTPRPPTELTYEIVNLSPDGGVLLLERVAPNRTRHSYERMQ